jgi:hypothetical protein
LEAGRLKGPADGVAQRHVVFGYNDPHDTAISRNFPANDILAT